MVDCFSLLSGKFGEEEAKKRIDAKISSFSGLLTREAAAKLIAAEEGLLKEEISEISSIQDDAPSVSVKGGIGRIFPMQEYRTGKRSRSFILKDSSGSIEVKLWNGDADSLSKFHLGDKITVSNAYGRNGILNVGYRGKIELESRSEILSPSTLKEGMLSCSGKVSHIEGGNPFRFSISDGPAEAKVEIVHNPSRGESISKGDSILLEGAEFDGEKLTMGQGSRILLRRNSPNIHRGPLGALKQEGSSFSICVGGEEFSAPPEVLVKFLNLDAINEDIDLGVAAGMKTRSLEGKQASVLFECREGKKEAKEISIR
jgi:hypothetical protein